MHAERMIQRRIVSVQRCSVVVLLVLVLLLLSVLTADSYVMESGKRWMYQNKHPIAYEYAYNKDNVSPMNKDDNDATPVLLLNGFGMGSFHQHRLMERLIVDNDNDKNNLVVYGMDYLGQGQSWPIDCNDGMSESELGLRYCGTMWMDQIIQFIEQVIVPASSSTNGKKKKKVHVVGNSVGGHLAVCLAASRPDLVETVVLLNATPVWGLNLPGWSGHLPAPAIPKAVGRFLFDYMRHPNTIQEFLQQTYVNPNAYDSTLIQQVHECTTTNGGHAAFASILWSPPVTVSLPDGSGSATGFYDALSHIKCDVLLCFGKDDPWCKPAFAKRMLQTLQQRGQQEQLAEQRSSSTTSVTQRYIELSNVGHCANHEAPTATAQVLKAWLGAELSSSSRASVPLVVPKEEESSKKQQQQQQQQVVVVSEEWGEILVQEKKEDEIPLSFVDKLAVAFV